MGSLKKLVLILIWFGVCLPRGLPGQTPEPVVHAILFYSPTCPHCHEVINNNLIPLQNQYGSRLALLGFDISQSWANALYWEAIRFFEVPEVDWSVPFMIVGDEVLIGGIRIPSRLPTLIEEGLAGDGIDLPNFPALVTFFREQNILDPRYPDRLIALQEPGPDEAEEQAAEAGPDAPPPAEDSLPASDTATVLDSAAVADSALAQDPVSGQDSVAAPEPEVAGVAPAGVDAPVDSSLATPPDPDPVVAVDTGAVAGDPGAEPEVGAPSSEPAAEDTSSEGPSGEVGEQLEEPPSAELEATVAPGPGEAGEGEPGGLGAFGLEDAARQMDAISMADRFMMDPAGNSLSVLVLLIMLASLLLRGLPPTVKSGEWPSWTIPALVLVGVGVAAYLSFIEVTHADAVCGPVGDCNTVNQSEYARLFGVLPVGVLGLMGYGAILLMWILRKTGSDETRGKASLGLWAAALFGVFFSIYLTFLEPFVIGATCAWCLTSALVMTLLLWATAPMAAKAWPGITTASTEN